MTSKRFSRKLTDGVHVIVKIVREEWCDHAYAVSYIVDDEVLEQIKTGDVVPELF